MTLLLFLLFGFLILTLIFFRYYQLPEFKGPAPSRKGGYRVYLPQGSGKKVNKARLLQSWTE